MPSVVSGWGNSRDIPVSKGSEAPHLAFSPSGDILAIYEMNRKREDTIRIVEVATGGVLHTLEVPSFLSSNILEIDFTPYGHLALKSGNGEIRFWDPFTGAIVRGRTIRLDSFDSALCIRQFVFLENRDIAVEFGSRNLHIWSHETETVSEPLICDHLQM